MYDEARTNAPSRTSQVGDQFNSLESAIEDLHKSCLSLEERMKTVARPAVPEVANEGKQSADMLVPVAERIRSSALKVRMVTRMLHDLQQRVEL